MKYTEILTQGKCPVCKCQDGLLLWTVTSNAAAAHFISSRQDSPRYQRLVSHIEKLWSKNSCQIIRCSSCQFTYSYPYVAGDKDFYDLAHEGSSYPAWRWEFDVAFDLISKSAKQQPRILEIGAGDGAFIYKLLNAITPAENLVAIEYSEHGKAKIQSSGISCFAKDIRTISDDELGGKFDYICLFQVLEHLDHLDDLLQSFASHLNSEGQVIIAVPNNKRIEFNELNGALLDMPPNHIGRWTRKAFDQFAKNNNFVVLHHKYEPANFIAEAIQFVKYRLLKRSHNVNSLSNRVLFEKNRLIRGVGIRLIILIDTLLNFNKLVNLALKIRKRGGGCQLVILGRSNLS